MFIQGQMILIQPDFDITQRSVVTSNEPFWTAVLLLNKIMFESSTLRFRSCMKVIKKIDPIILRHGTPKFTGTMEKNLYYKIKIVDDWKNDL